MKKIPYGVSDFKVVRKENYYFVDHSWAIPIVEQDRYVFLLRPRRFGKSLFLNMLATYYDVLEKDNFDSLFSGLAIAHDPTSIHSSYLVLKFNFSDVGCNSNNVQPSFNDSVINTIDEFIKTYTGFFDYDESDRIRNRERSDAYLKWLIKVIHIAHQRMYVMIDEYDNFANTILSYDEKGYTDMTHADGFFRLFFNILKAGTTMNDAPIDRMFITGVSPLCLSDVTSGFNIGSNYSLDFRLNSAIGFSETEVRNMLAYYEHETGVFKHSVDELVGIMKPYYDSNCFAVECVNDERMFNSDMALYFLKEYVRKNGSLPDQMIDTNISTDYNKMKMLVRFERRFEQKSRLLQKITLQGWWRSELVREFSLGDLLKPSNVVSLLYYMGLLSWGPDERGRAVFVIPNEVVRQQYYHYMTECYAHTIDWQPDVAVLDELWSGFAYDGDCEALLAYLASLVKENSSVRDFGPEGEAFVKGFMLSHLCRTSSYYAQSEREASKGYMDIFLEPRTDVDHGVIIELKYCKASAPDSEVKSLLDDAVSQADRYAVDHSLLSRAAARNWTLHRAAMVFRGWSLAELKVW